MKTPLYYLYVLAGEKPDAPALRRIAARVARRVRSILIAVGCDPKIEVTHAPFGKLVLPFSHDLGQILYRHASFGCNLALIVGALSLKYKNVKALDIGANIGDTAKLMLNCGCSKVLCVEGDPKYLSFLRTNLNDCAGVDVAPVFLRFSAESQQFLPTSSRGSLHFEKTAGDGEVGFVELAELIVEYQQYSDLHLLKTDTDGLDLHIILRNIDVIEKTTPVIFIEYLPFLFRHFEAEPARFFAALYRIGYRYIAVYDNVGRFVMLEDLGENSAALMQLLAYFDFDDDRIYTDLAIFHEKDRDIVSALYPLFR